MIISRTPYRVSYFGGGTDYQPWFQQHGAAILSTTINHYCYLNCRILPPFFKHKHRVVWSYLEEVAHASEIKHPAVRAVLDYLAIDKGIEVNYQGDLPSRSGLGSSSAFTVGLLNAMYALGGIISSKRQLASEAIHVERHILHENVGLQDQIATAYGGLNKIVIQPNGHFDVHPIILTPSRLKQFQDHLVLFFTGISRNASDIAGDKINSIPDKTQELHAMQHMVDQAIKILTDGDLLDFGRLLHESWLLKRGIAKSISSSFIDEVYAKACKAGAVGGKLLGAGGGGFMLFFVKPENHASVCAALKELLMVPFEFESSGSQIIFHDTRQYSLSAVTRRDYIHLQSAIKT